VRTHRLTTALTTIALLGAPAAHALADSGGGAGDQEYQDPLTAPSTPKKKHKPVAQTAPATSTAPATTTTSTTTSSAAGAGPSAAGSSATASTPQLPRTGAPTELVGATGLVLVGAGVVLRRRSAQQ
jgi:LPXTG-motif cell wall-anchored protein